MKKLWIAVGAGALLIASSAVAAPKLVLPPAVQVPPLSPDAKPQSVSFARAAFQIPEGKVWAYDEFGFILCGIHAQPAKWAAADWEPDTARLGSVFQDEATRAGFSAPKSTNLFDADSSSTRYRIAALITDMDGRFCHEPPRTIGRMTMTVEWQLYDTLSREVVLRVPTVGGARQDRGVTEGVVTVFMGAFRENVRALLADESYRAAITRAGQAAPPRTLPAIYFRPTPLEKRTIAASSGSVVAVFAGDGHGTGFLISADGHVLTNQHVVGDAKFVKVRWPDRTESLGEVIRADRVRDVAVIKVDAAGRKPLALRTNPAALGEAVFAIGTPLDAKFQGTVTKGIVSSNRTYDGQAFIQSDVGINPGNSGGPLLDEGGAVLGVAVSRYQVGDAPTGLNLFIPIGDALDALALKPAS